MSRLVWAVRQAWSDSSENRESYDRMVVPSHRRERRALIPFYKGGGGARTTLIEKGPRSSSSGRRGAALPLSYATRSAAREAILGLDQALVARIIEEQRSASGMPSAECGMVTAEDLEAVLRFVQERGAAVARHDALVALRDAADVLLASPEKRRLKKIAQEWTTSVTTQQQQNHVQGNGTALEIGSSSPYDRRSHTQYRAGGGSRAALSRDRRSSAVVANDSLSREVVDVSEVLEGRSSKLATVDADRGEPATVESLAEPDALLDERSGMPTMMNSSVVMMTLSELSTRLHVLWNELGTPHRVRREVEANLLARDTPWCRHEINLHVANLMQERERLAAVRASQEKREATIKKVIAVAQQYAAFAGTISAAAMVHEDNTMPSLKGRLTLSAIHQQLWRALDVYRDATIDLVECISKWNHCSGHLRLPLQPGAAETLITCIINELYQRAFLNQPVAFLLSLEAAYNPLALQSAIDSGTIGVQRGEQCVPSLIPAHVVVHRGMTNRDALRRYANTAIASRGIGTLVKVNTVYGGGGARHLGDAYSNVSSQLERGKESMKLLAQWVVSLCIVPAQAGARMTLVRRRYRRLLSSLRIIQRVARGGRHRQVVRQTQRLTSQLLIARVAIALYWRRVVARRARAVVTAQRVVRGFLDRCRVWRWKEAASRIQRQVRGVISRRRLRELRFEKRVRTLQRAGRRLLAFEHARAWIRSTRAALEEAVSRCVVNESWRRADVLRAWQAEACGISHRVIQWSMVEQFHQLSRLELEYRESIQRRGTVEHCEANEWEALTHSSVQSEFAAQEAAQYRCLLGLAERCLFSHHDMYNECVRILVTEVETDCRRQLETLEEEERLRQLTAPAALASIAFTELVARQNLERAALSGHDRIASHSRVSASAQRLLDAEAIARSHLQQAELQCFETTTRRLMEGAALDATASLLAQVVLVDDECFWRAKHTAAAEEYLQYHLAAIHGLWLDEYQQRVAIERSGVEGSAAIAAESRAAAIKASAGRQLLFETTPQPSSILWRSTLIVIRRLQRCGRGYLVRCRSLLSLLHGEHSRRLQLTEESLVALLTAAEGHSRRLVENNFTDSITEMRAVSRVTKGLLSRAVNRRLNHQLRVLASWLIAIASRRALYPRLTTLRCAKIERAEREDRDRMEEKQRVEWLQLDQVLHEHYDAALFSDACREERNCLLRRELETRGSLVAAEALSRYAYEAEGSHVRLGLVGLYRLLLDSSEGWTALASLSLQQRRRALLLDRVRRRVSVVMIAQLLRCYREQRKAEASRNLLRLEPEHEPMGDLSEGPDGAPPLVKTTTEEKDFTGGLTSEEEDAAARILQRVLRAYHARQVVTGTERDKRQSVVPLPRRRKQQHDAACIIARFFRRCILTRRRGAAGLEQRRISRDAAARSIARWWRRHYRGASSSSSLSRPLHHREAQIIQCAWRRTLARRQLRAVKRQEAASRVEAQDAATVIAVGPLMPLHDGPEKGVLHDSSSTHVPKHSGEASVSPPSLRNVDDIFAAVFEADPATATANNSSHIAEPARHWCVTIDDADLLLEASPRGTAASYHDGADERMDDEGSTVARFDVWNACFGAPLDVPAAARSAPHVVPAAARSAPLDVPARGSWTRSSENHERFGFLTGGVVAPPPEGPGSARRAVAAVAATRTIHLDDAAGIDAYHPPSGIVATRERPPHALSAEVTQREPSPPWRSPAARKPSHSLVQQMAVWAQQADSLLRSIDRPIAPDFISPVRLPELFVEPPSSPRPDHQRDTVESASRAVTVERLHPLGLRRSVGWLDDYLMQVRQKFSR